MGLFRRPEGSLEDYQPRLWAIVIGLGLLVLWVIAFIAKNSDNVKIDFVLFSKDASLIWLVIILLGAATALVLRREARRVDSPA